MKAIKFLISGGSAATVEYFIFIFLQHFLGNEGLIASQTISLLSGFVISFALNKQWVFKSGGNTHVELAKYGMLLGVNLVITNILMYVMVNYTEIEYWLAKIILMAMVATWNYFIFQKFVFRSKTSNEDKR